jgi:hypothetical protein
VAFRAARVSKRAITPAPNRTDVRLPGRDKLWQLAVGLCESLPRGGFKLILKFHDRGSIDEDCHRIALPVNHISNGSLDISLPPEPPRTAMAGPPLCVAIVQAAAIQRSSAVGFEVVHNPLG